MSPTSPPTLADQIRISDDAARFLAAMLATDYLVDGVPYFLEKPEKWQSEYSSWMRAGRPDCWPDDFVTP